LLEDRDDASIFGSGYGYKDEAIEMGANVSYRNQLLKHELGIPMQTESFKLYDFAVKKLSKIITQVSPSTVIDFGVSYGHIDSILAKRFPDIKFVGVDRSTDTKAYNDKYFNLPNLKFVAGDIFDNLPDNSLLIQMRIGVLLSKSFLEKLYRACYKAGVKNIVLLEPHGISWLSGVSYAFSDQDQDSIVFRSGMFIHNYPGILRTAGYEVYDSGLLETDHQDGDYRILYMAAKAGPAPGL
jgi:hypothetical protein